MSFSKPGEGDEEINLAERVATGDFLTRSLSGLAAEIRALLRGDNEQDIGGLSQTDQGILHYLKNILEMRGGNYAQWPEDVLDALSQLPPETRISFRKGESSIRITIPSGTVDEADIAILKKEFDVRIVDLLFFH